MSHRLKKHCAVYITQRLGYSFRDTAITPSSPLALRHFKQSRAQNKSSDPFNDGRHAHGDVLTLVGAAASAVFHRCRIWSVCRRVRAWYLTSVSLLFIWDFL